MDISCVHEIPYALCHLQYCNYPQWYIYNICNLMEFLTNCVTVLLVFNLFSLFKLIMIHLTSCVQVDDLMVSWFDGVWIRKELGLDFGFSINLNFGHDSLWFGDPANCKLVAPDLRYHAIKHSDILLKYHDPSLLFWYLWSLVSL